MNEPIHNQPIIDDFEFELRGDTTPAFSGVAIGQRPPVMARLAGTVRAVLDGLRGKTAALFKAEASAGRGQQAPLGRPRLRAFRATPGRIRYRPSGQRRPAPPAAATTLSAGAGPGDGAPAGEATTTQEGELEAKGSGVDGAGGPAAPRGRAVPVGGPFARVRTRSRRVRRHQGFGIPIT